MKHPSKNIPCAHCGRDGPVKSNRSRRQVSERRENTKDTATMTETIKLETSSTNQVQGSISELTTVGGTFIAGPPPGSVQVYIRFASDCTIYQMNNKNLKLVISKTVIIQLNFF